MNFCSYRKKGLFTLISADYMCVTNDNFSLKRVNAHLISFFTMKRIRQHFVSQVGTIKSNVHLVTLPKIFFSMPKMIYIWSFIPHLEFHFPFLIYALYSFFSTTVWLFHCRGFACNIKRRRQDMDFFFRL